MSDEVVVIPEEEITAEVPAVESEPVIEEKKVFKKVIQPLDGEGKPIGQPHVYESDTQEGLEAKMAEAIANGTRKINELSRKAVLERPKDPEGAEIQVEEPVWKPRELTEDEKFIVKTDPEQAFEINFKAKFGMSSAEFAEKQRQRDDDVKVTREKAETDMFIDDTPEFYRCAENQQAMIQWMENHPLLAWRKKNLALAYKELSESGLLKAKPEATPVVPAPVVEARTEPPPPAVKPDFPVVIRNGSSRAAAPIKPKDGKPTAAEIGMMSSDEIKKLYPELRDAR